MQLATAFDAWDKKNASLFSKHVFVFSDDNNNTHLHSATMLYFQNHNHILKCIG